MQYTIIVERGPRNFSSYPAFAENAWDGLVNLHACRGLLQVNAAFESGRKNIRDEALMLPGNSAARCAWVDKTFRRYAKHLARIIPGQKRWKSGR